METETEMETEMEMEIEIEAAAVTTRMMETVRKAAETVANWEVKRIMEMDGEGTMVDDDGTGMEVTAECF
jgi:hypothetical protein